MVIRLKPRSSCLNQLSLFDLYEGYLTQKRSKNARELLQAFYELTPNPIELVVSEQANNKNKWDERWVQCFVELNEEELVCRFANRPDKKVVSYLVEKSKVAPQLRKPGTLHILYTLFRLGIAKRRKFLCRCLKGFNSAALLLFGARDRAINCYAP